MRTLKTVVFSLGLAIVVAASAISADTPKEAVAPERIQQLIRDLGSDSFDAREKASAELVALGKSALPYLESAEKSDDAEVRIRAHRAIGAISSSVNYLVELLRSKDPDSRKQAAEKLATLGPVGKPALPRLKELLKDSAEGVREAALGAVLNIDPNDKDIGKLVPAKASAEGKYRTLRRRIKVPQDRDQYKEYCDYGRFEGNSWAGYSDLPPGYWVYVYPYWFIWEEQAK
jgi:HEAT repeat protein